jgi:hypothetical protein
LANNNRETLENYVDEAIALIAARHETLQSCAVRYGPLWAQMQGPVEAALRLRVWGQLHFTNTANTFDSASQAAGWERLQQLITNTNARPDIIATTAPYNYDAVANSASDSFDNSAKPNNIINFESSSNRRQRQMGLLNIGLRVAAIFLVFLILGAVLVTLIEFSEPGAVLYGAKLNLEHVGEVLAFSPESKLDANLAYANQRLNEINHAVDQSQYKDIDQTLLSYQNSIGSISNLANQTNAPQVLTQLTQQQQQLINLELQSTLPPTLQAQLHGLVQYNQSQISNVQKKVTSSGGPPSRTYNPNPTPTIAPLTSKPATTSGVLATPKPYKPEPTATTVGNPTCTVGSGHTDGIVTAKTTSQFTLGATLTGGTRRPLNLKVNANTVFIHNGQAVPYSYLQVGMQVSLVVEGDCSGNYIAVKVTIG